MAHSLPTGASRRAMLGLFDRRERWSFSSRGRLILAFALLLISVLVFRSVYPFLAITNRVDADVLVVEGWVPEYATRVAVEEFRNHPYMRVFATGGPVEGMGGYTNDYQTWASVGADLLRKDGIPKESLTMVPSRVMDRDRTYGSAVALRNWCREQKMSVRSMNVVTEDVHARRTRLLFQEALGKDITIGIIAVPNPDYDSKRWWHYSEGVKDVLNEGVAYLYAKLFFYPSGLYAVRK